VLTKLHELLMASKLPKEYESLAASDRRAILEIVRDTVPDVPDCWGESK
jgi:hypothetical protein